jgi:hypothetical protein
LSAISRDLAEELVILDRARGKVGIAASVAGSMLKCSFSR